MNTPYLDRIMKMLDTLGRNHGSSNFNQEIMNAQDELKELKKRLKDLSDEI